MEIRRFATVAMALAQLSSLVTYTLPALAKGVDPEEKVEYYLFDHLGGVDAVLDEGGNVAKRRDYLPFGEERVADGVGDERHGFTGKELDDESGLYYYGARYYDPMIGRFTSVDPLVMGEAGKPIQSILSDPQAMNGYCYGLNNPLRFIDPTGMITKDGIVEKGDTLGEIAQTLNKANGTSYSVSQFAKLNNIENPDKIFVGQRLIPNNIIKDVTGALNAEIEKWVGAVLQFKDEGATSKALIFGKYSTDPDKMNLKLRPNSVFNTAENQGRDYVFEGEKIRYDAPANILYGYVGKYFGYESTTLTGFAGLFQAYGDAKNLNGFFNKGFHSPNFGDDPVDTGYIMEGINKFINPIFQPK